MSEIHISDIPNNWALSSLDDILVNFESGSRPKGGVKGIKIGIPSVGGEHLNKYGSFNFSETKFVPEEFFKDMNKGKIKLGDILIVKDGATTGKTSIVREDFPFKKAAVNEHVFLARPFNDIDNIYLFYYLYSPYGQYFVKKNFKGTAQGGINLSFAKNTNIPIPPTKEQKRIMTKIEELFTRLDASVEDLERTKELLKTYRQSLLKHVFEGKLTQKWREDHKDELEPASILLERIKEERKEYLGKKYKELQPLSPSELKELPKIPDTWLWQKAANIVNGVNNGSTPKADLLNTNESKIPFLKVYNLTFSGELNFNKDPTFIELETHTNQLYRSIVYPGDVLINIVGPPLGKISLVPETYPEWNINQAIVAFHPNKFINSNFLLYAFQSKFIMNWLLKTGKATAGQTNIKLSTCRELPLPLIPLTEQNEIIKQLDTIIPSINKISETIDYNLQKTKKLRQSILKKAFTGYLVPQEPDDEPAKILLERIKAEKEILKPKRKRKTRKKKVKSSQEVLV